jgi:CBS domain-containing protein
MRLMADQDIGFLIVMDKAEIVGVLSERDCTRKLLLVGKSPEATPVGTIMARDVIKADIGDTFAHCLKLMHEHGIRHLPVMDKGVAVGVVSVRDLMGEAVAHHAKVIGELERERMTMLTSTA